MRKNILLAGVLSLAAIFGTVAIYNTYFLPAPAFEDAAVLAGASGFEGAAALDRAPSAAFSEEEVVWENRLFRAVFSPRGALLTSFKLKEYGEAEMVLSSPSSPEAPLFFRWGGMDAPVLERGFRVTRTARSLTFSTSLESPARGVVNLEKTYSFSPDDYMIKVEIRLTGEQPLPATPGGVLYTLGLGPQTGPPYGELDGKYDYRHFLVNEGGEKRNFKVPEPGTRVSGEGALFAGVEGKYFVSLILLPREPLGLAWDARPQQDLEVRRSLGVQRMIPGNSPSEVADTYYLFLGPKDLGVLSSYEREGDNPWGLSGAGLGTVAGPAGLWRVFTEAVRHILMLLHRPTGNHGLSVILLALLVEAALFAFKRPSLEAHGKMRLYRKEVADIKKRWPGDSKKALAQIGEFYAARGITPRPATRTLLFHLPVFLFLYILFFTHLDLRGAAFLPGLIPDLSRPDSWFSLSGMPLAGGKDVRLLPLLVLAVTLLQSRVVQPPPETFGTLRAMSILLPVMIFLVLYDMPSGAVLYWLTQTAAAVGLQIFYNRKMARP